MQTKREQVSFALSQVHEMAGKLVEECGLLFSSEDLAVKGKREQLVGRLDSEEVGEIAPVLNHLISICKDGEYGYKTAAVDARAPAATELFALYAAQRARFARELSALVAELGFEPETEGSVAGLLHREWIDVKVALTQVRTLDVVLAECARGEESACKAYVDAVRRPIGAKALAVVQRQLAAIEAARESIRSLRSGG